LQPIKHSPDVETFKTRRVAVIDGDREAAEMLHMFFRLMELECSLISPATDVVATLRRVDPDVVILDLDLPDLRSLDLAREIRAPVIFVTDDDPTFAAVARPVIRKPRDRFEDLLRLMEMVLALEE
jgi:DNA-binding NtrC family response regulator